MDTKSKIPGMELRRLEDAPGAVGFAKEVQTLIARNRLVKARIVQELEARGVSLEHAERIVNLNRDEDA